MGRNYADDSYSAHQTLVLPGKGSIDGTYQTATDWIRYTFMYPAKVIDANLMWLTGGTNWGADTAIYLGKSAAGTGAVSVFGTGTMGTDGTQADASVQDLSVTEQAFSAGDDLVVQVVGTVGLASIVVPCFEIMEAFEASDS